MTSAVLDAIRTRRVARRMTDEPVTPEQLETILRAARWAPSAGNRRPHRFVVVDDPTAMRLVAAVSPGMLVRPPLMIVICIDRDVVRRHGLPPTNPSLAFDVGTSAQTIMLAAQAIGLASGPIASFSAAAVSVVLRMPDALSPQLMIAIGHAAREDRPMRAGAPGLTWRDLALRAPFGDH